MEKRLIMNMKYMIVAILLTAISCQEQLNLDGEWEYIRESNCDINPLGFFVDSAPINDFGHKIYFTEDTIFNPSLMIGKLPSSSKYHLKRNEVIIEDLGKFGCEVINDTLKIRSNKCIMTFVKIKNRPVVSYQKIMFIRKDDNGSVKDSLAIGLRSYTDRITRKEIEGDYSHLFKLGSLIMNKNESFGQQSNDVDCYWIELIDEKGEVNKVSSCGNYNVPFEIRTLIRYINNL